MAAPSRDDIARVAGPESMAKPDAPPSAVNPTKANDTAEPAGGSSKKKRHRGGKNRRKNRRQSFIAPSESNADMEERPSLLDVPSRQSSKSVKAGQQSSFYRLQSGNRSNTSLESEALLDHREHAPMRNRRFSHQQSFARSNAAFSRNRGSHVSAQPSGAQRAALSRGTDTFKSDDEEENNATDRTPLLGASSKNRPKPELSRNNSAAKYGTSGSGYRPRRSSGGSKASSKRGRDIPSRGREVSFDEDDEYDVNNPPSVPASPKLGSLDDIMIAELSSSATDRGRDAVITIDDDMDDRHYSGSSPDDTRRRPTLAEMAERDVCFPGDGLSEIGEEDDHHSHQGSPRTRRRRTKQWPELDILEEWSRVEKEERTQQEHVRSKKISEPVMVGGRLRPGKTVWHREENDDPFRFTYFNEAFDGTIHARTISDLLQDGANFHDLFRPDPPELSDDSEDDDDDNLLQRPPMRNASGKANGDLAARPSGYGSELEGGHDDHRSPSASKSATGSNTPVGRDSQAATPRPDQRRGKRYGPRPTFWLDILKPTDEEMKVLSRAFGIHQLTAEDILMQEQREKVELFNNYYFVNYRSFEQDPNNEDYMEPVNIAIIVFRNGVLTFHDSMTPHPANVRRRIRQLSDYMSPNADWISYAIIDDVTDVYAPLVQQIEVEVDQIDDAILYMHQSSADQALPETSSGNGGSKSGKNQNSSSEKDGGGGLTQGDMGAQKAEGERTAGDSGGDMLRRVGECRKRVMSLYRLLGTKADVIKGFAKRCNEHWEVAPRSEIGLYLGDIQDHIVTMTGNLSHYEKCVPAAISQPPH